MGNVVTALKQENATTYICSLACSHTVQGASMDIEQISSYLIFSSSPTDDHEEEETSAATIATLLAEEARKKEMWEEMLPGQVV